jgi:hypothetical protein
MPYAKSSKGKGRRKVGLALGAIGALSLADSAAANALTPIGDAPSPRPAPEITLSEEEVWDVSLGTFYVFDKEISGRVGLGEQFARKGKAAIILACHGCGGCRACSACSCRTCRCSGCRR